MKINNIIVSLLMITFLVACESDKNPHDHPELKTGKQLYDFHCAACHGENGTGNFLSGIPANRNTQLTIDQIIKRVLAKEPGDSKRKMPVFPEMSQEEAHKIAAYLLELKRKEPPK